MNATTTNDYDPSLWSLSETIVRLRRERNEARADVERLNQMLRETGYGQGQIDAYAAQCEEIERLRAKLTAATTTREPFAVGED